MQLYNYTAKDKNGEVQRGEIEAENENAAAKILLSRDLVPIDVYKESDQGFALFNKVSLKNKVLIARQLATMINAGLPIAQSLRTLEEQTINKGLKKILEEVSGDVEGGSQLSVAFARFPEFFSDLDITLIASGEASGSLDKALLRLAEQLEKEQSLLRKIRGALIYPTFIVVAVIAVAILMTIYVMPQMEELYKSFNAQLPFLTRAMIAFSHFLETFGIVVIIFLVVLTIYIRVMIRRPFGRRAWDHFKLQILGVNKLLEMAYMTRFANTLSGLVASGVPLLDALKIVSRAVGNVVYEDAILEAAEKVKSGIALSEPLKENSLFPPVVAQMISVGEQTGELDSMLANLGHYFEEEVDTLVKGISNLIEPILIVVIGGFVGLIIVAIMLPIYSLGGVLFK